MENRENKYNITLKNLIDETCKVLELYPNKKVVLLGDDTDRQLPYVMAGLTSRNLDYIFSNNGVPKDAGDTYLIHMRSININKNI